MRKLFLYSVIKLFWLLPKEEEEEEEARYGILWTHHDEFGFS